MFKFIKNKILVYKINKALEFKLNDQQIKFIFEDKNVFTGRVQGKTTAFIIKLLISKSEIDVRALSQGYYSDESFGIGYIKFFEKEFYLIEEKLRKVGIKTAKLSHSSLKGGKKCLRR